MTVNNILKDVSEINYKQSPIKSKSKSKEKKKEEGGATQEERKKDN